MKKLIAALGLFLLFSGAALAVIDYPSNPAVSPKDMNPGMAGWQGYLYIPNTVSNTVKPVYIDYSSAAGVFADRATFSVGGKPRGIAVSSNGEKVYVATETSIKVYSYDAVGPIATPLYPALSDLRFNSLRGIALSPDGKRLYAADPAANKVHVIDVSGIPTYLSSIIVDGVTVSAINAPGAFSVAVSPDDGMLVIVKRSDVSGSQHTGAVSFIRIIKVRNLDGTYSITYDSASLVGKTISNLNFPTYAVISGDPQRIYIRTHEDGVSTYPNADILIFDGASLNALSTSIPSTFINIEGLGRGVDHEPIGLATNGKYLYLTHYKSSDGYAHAYRIATSLNDGSVRSNWTWDALLDLEVHTTLSQYTDGIAFVPNGGRILFTRSDTGTYTYTKRTGFTDPAASYDLTNPLPGAPSLVHPVTANDGELAMHNYLGNAEWNAPIDEPLANLHYDIDYKRVGTETWNQLAGMSMPGYTNYFDFITSTSVLLMGIPSDGSYYQVRVRAYDSTWADPARSGPYIISEMFRKAKPTIDTLNDGATGLLTGISYYDNTLLINGSGFGYRTTPADRMTSDFHVSFFQGGVEKIIPAKVGPTDKGVESWENNRITLTIPRSFTDGYLQPGTFDVKVKAFNLFSNTKPLMIGPKLYEARNTITGELNRGSAGQRIKLTGKGIQSDTIIDLYHRLSPSSGVRIHTATVEASFVAPGVDGSSSLDFIVPASSLYSSYPDWYILAYSNGRPNKDTDITFTVNTVSVPQITSFEVDTNPDPLVNEWAPTTSAYVYDHIRITGTGFGSDPGDGNRDTAFNRVTIAGQVIRDDLGSDGLQVYSWSDTAIEIGIPRRIGATFTNVGANEISVTTPGGANTSNLNIKPRVYGVNPGSGTAGTMVSVTVSGTALEGARDITIGGVSGGAGTITRQNGTDPDGTAGNDQVVISLTLGAATGLQPVVATVNSQVSNNDVTFNVLPAGTPNPLVVIPNVAPTGAPIDVRVTGSGFLNTTTVKLAHTGQPDIIGVVDRARSTDIVLYVNLNLTTALVGDWDVVVANGALEGRLTKGFKVIPAGGPISQIIDDYEGSAVTYPADYTFFGGPMTLTISTTDYHEGTNAGQVEYPLSALGYRGLNGNLNAALLDISNFNTISLRLKGNAGMSATGRAKFQFTDGKGDVYGATTDARYIVLNNAAWTEYQIPLIEFGQLDAAGNRVAGGGVARDNFITNYQFVFTENAASTGPILADYIVATGYTPPTQGPISTTIARAGDTVGSGITLSWTVSDGYAGNYNVYRKTGAWDAADGVFTTTAAGWGTPWRSGVMSPVTDDTQVGQGTQTYYKVVKSADVLSDAMLLSDVVGKFDISVGPSDTQPDKFFISLPLVPIVPRTNSLVDVFGAQVSEGDGVLTFNMNKDVLTGSLYSVGAWSAFPGATAISNVDWGRSYGYLTMTEKYLTIVGKVPESANLLSLTGGWDGTHDYAAVAEWIANSYPVPVTITTSALGSSTSRGASPLDGGTVYQFNANADLMGGVDGMAVNTTAGWVSGTLTDPSTLRLVPGRGYMLNEPVNSAFTWAQPKPY